MNYSIDQSTHELTDGVAQLPRWVRLEVSAHRASPKVKLTVFDVLHKIIP
jgi:hypothetical protein